MSRQKRRRFTPPAAARPVAPSSASILEWARAEKAAWDRLVNGRHALDIARARGDAFGVAAGAVQLQDALQRYALAAQAAAEGVQTSATAAST